MIFKIIYTVIVLVICFIVYYNIRENEHSLGFIIVTGIIATIIGNLLIPSNISLFDIFEQVKEVSSDTQNDKPENDISENNIPVSTETTNKLKDIENLEQANGSEYTDEPSISEEQLPESNVGELNILPISTTNKNIDSITDQLLAIEPVELNYYEGNITTDEQIDTYQFVPALNGRYRFEIAEMLSGVKINITVLNQAGDRVEGTSYGIENGGGLTIDNMVANETYTIQIKQCSSYSSYKVLIGVQKNIVSIDNGINQITDNIQYTEQKNIYQFTPPLNGRYRFELDEMISGTKVNMSIYNPGGERVDGTSYGITNGDGLTIDNMNANETYNIIITQYISITNYKILIGYQKEPVKINGETEITDSIQYTSQLNQYQFTPPINGRYRFEISDITSGVQINMIVLNQAGGRVDGTAYGISKNDGLTIDGMVAGETYTIQIVQYNSYSPYKLKIGYQKEIIELNANSVSDVMQYTQQQNIYHFNPQTNGSHSFIIDKMVSGMKINMSIYNEGGERIDGTSYGIENGNGLTIENMIKGETYTIYITQYESDGSYVLFVN